jgi:8-oxo-dGTP pyrophosphatase MutT (NUDIX family)
MQQMYKVFVNQRTIYLSGNIDHTCIGADEQPVKCTNLVEVENAFSHFLSESSIARLYLFFPGDSEKLFQLFATMFSFIEAAGGLVIDPKNHMLFIKRLGFWDLPKGKIEKGEDAPTAALREVSEETGLINLRITMPLPSTYHIFERKGKLRLKRTYWFEMKSSSDGPLCPQIEEDIIEARWFRYQDIEQPLSTTYPAIKELVEGYLAEHF